MAIISTAASSTDVFQTVVDIDIDTVLTQTASEYSWLTAGGDRITLRGTSLVHSGSTLTSGSIYNIEIDIANNGTTDLSVSYTSGLPAVAVLVSGDNNAFWAEVLKGADTLNYASGTTSGFLSGDGRYTSSPTTNAGADTFFVTAGGGEVSGDYYGSISGTLTGGDDLFRIDVTTPASTVTIVVGDVRIVAGTLVGGDDVILDHSTLGASSSTLYAYGDATTAYLSNTGTVTGGNDYMRFADWSVVAAGDVGFQQSPTIQITGGDDVMIAGDGGALFIGDVISMFSAQDTTLTAGNDTMIGGAGNDRIYGEFETDMRSNGTTIGGNDRVHGVGGNDRIFGQFGDDTLFGGAGSDTIEGGEGNDLIGGGHTFDMISLNEERRDQGQFTALYGADMMPTDRMMLEFLYRSFAHESELTGSFISLVSYSVPGNNNEILILGDIGATLRVEVAGRSFTTAFATENLLTGAHHRISLAFNSSTDFLRLYVDGAVVHESSATPLDPIESGGILILGQEQDAHGGRFDPNQAGQGQIGDIRLFNTTYSQTFIERSIGEAINPATFGLVANWQADAATGSIINTVDPARPMILMGGAGVIDGGTDGNDRLLGGAGSDSIYGHDGNDTLIGGEGPDALFGGNGNDRLEAGPGMFGELDGGAGNDTLVAGPDSQQMNGGDGNDLIYLSQTGNDSGSGGAGDDTIIAGPAANYQSFFGGDGNDLMQTTGGLLRFWGDAGNDTLDGSLSTEGIDFIGGSGDDLLIGGDFDDSLDSGEGADELQGGAGNDTLEGGPGNDTLLGGNGDDLVVSLSGNNVLNGGGGNDTLHPGVNSDTLVGGNGRDVLDYSSHTGGGEPAGFYTLTIDIAAGTAFSTYSQDESFSGIEDIWLGAGHDTVMGDTNSNRIEGNAGNDNLHGGDGSARDVLLGGAGSDTLNGGLGKDIVNGGGGNDVLIGSAGNDILIGGTGDDVISGGSGADIFVFVAEWSNDRVPDFEPGVDRVRIVSSFSENDVILTQQGADVLFSITGSSDTILFQNQLVADIDVFGPDFVFV